MQRWHRAGAPEPVFSARVAIETGLRHALEAPVPRARLARLEQHLKAEQAAARAGEPGQRSYLLGDSHVCLAECMAGPVMGDILRDLTTRWLACAPRWRRAGATLLATGAAQAQGTLDAAMSKKQINIAVPADCPPDGFVGTDMAPRGLDVDMDRLIAAKLELLPVNSANRIPCRRLHQGRGRGCLRAGACRFVSIGNLDA